MNCDLDVDVNQLVAGNSPRLAGESGAHVWALAQVIDFTPPILVHQSTMRVIDGMHRLRAAMLIGRPTVRARLIDCSEAEIFVLAIQENTRHGLPFSLRDREAAALRLLASVTNWSDRMIAETVGHHLLFAGHSVGELAAAAGAGFLSPTAAIALSRARGIAMSAACAVRKTGMAAVMPGKREPATDEDIVAAIGAAELTIANWNGSRQFVGADPAGLLEDFTAAPPAGMRIAPLEVAGPFHTEAMEPAKAPFAQAVKKAPVLHPTSPILGNGDGAVISDPVGLRQRLVAQIISPVRWDKCSATIASLSGPATVRIELAPAGPLTRLAERAHPGTRVVALRTPRDADQAWGEGHEQDRLSRTGRHLHPAGPHRFRSGRERLPRTLRGRRAGRGTRR